MIEKAKTQQTDGEVTTQIDANQNGATQTAASQTDVMPSVVNQHVATPVDTTHIDAFPTGDTQTAANQNEAPPTDVIPNAAT